MKSGGGKKRLLSGIVDPLRRPIVELSISGGRTLRCLVDTGYNRELMFDEQVSAEFGVVAPNLYGYGPRLTHDQYVRQTVGRPIEVKLGRLKVNWGGDERDVVVKIVQEALSFDHDDVFGPQALLGCGMLDDTVLAIDFRIKSVEVLGH